MNQSPHNPPSSDDPEQPAYGYLKSSEAQFLDAAVGHLIPADELGPGAVEAGVTCFIDRQLVSSWGTHGRNYRMGPWQEGTPQQGFQSKLNPQEIYRIAIHETDVHCRQQYGKNFSVLTSEQQEEVLHGLEDGKIEFQSVSSKLFFSLLLRNTVEGFFADPIYGGNRNKVGWKLIGFPGVASWSYAEHLEIRGDVPYKVEPVGIEDILQGRAKVDAQGYPKHVHLDDREK